MTASLPMYDRPETATANDRFWRGIRQAYGHGPQFLDRDSDPHDTWSDPGLVFSQTCGLPYRSGLHGKVQLVGTPDYDVEGCAPGYYRSVIVVRANDPRERLDGFRSAILARNDVRSQSGWAALLAHLRAGEPSLADWQITDTGSHAASALAVVEGRADLAAIDAVTWRLLLRHDPQMARLRVLEMTDPTPGLPYITGPQEDATALLLATRTAVSDMSDEDRDCLMLRGVVSIPASAYLKVALP